MKGVIITNGYYKSIPYTHQVNRLCQEFEERGVAVTVYENRFPIELSKPFDFDFAVFLDKDIALAQILENQGIRVFNSSKAIETADSKIKTAVALKKFGVKMPITIPAPVRYSYKADYEYLQETAEILNFPLIVKEDRGSLGAGVYLAKNEKELIDIDGQLGIRPKLYQQFIGQSAGKSYRVIVIGSKVIAAIMLVNEHDFRSNANLGGEAKAVILNDNYIKAAQDISRYLELDFCGIDFFVNEEMVLEVNSNAFFETVEKITGINVAKAYVDNIINTIRRTAK